jgi:membrane-bound serine protease (ClpP class)
VGAIGIVERVTPDATWVRLDGELWHAESAAALSEHDEVTVDALDGLVLKVSKPGKEKD